MESNSQFSYLKKFDLRALFNFLDHGFASSRLRKRVKMFPVRASNDGELRRAMKRNGRFTHTQVKEKTSGGSASFNGNKLT